MKKSLLFFAALILINCSVFAQIKFGVKSGLNVSTIFFDPDPELDISPLASFHLGAFLNYGFTDNIGLQVELMYSGEGGRLTGETLGEIVGTVEDLDQELKDRYSFLCLPILLKYHHQSGFTAEIGPTVNFLLSAKSTNTLSNDDASLALTQDFDESVNGTDIKFALGAGYELASGLSFNGRFSFSVSNIFTQEYTDSVGGQEGFISMFQLSAGFPVFAK